MNAIKKLSSLLILLLCFQTVTASKKKKENSSTINWLSIEEAEKLSKENPKPIFFDFYTKTCTYCKKMDRTTFKDEKVVSYLNENYYAVKVNAADQSKITFKGKKTTNRAIAKNLKLRGFPSYVFFDKDFKYKKTEIGYKKSRNFLQIIKSNN